LLDRQNKTYRTVTKHRFHTCCDIEAQNDQFVTPPQATTQALALKHW
jgi:hypothetical protein